MLGLAFLFALFFIIFVMLGFTAHMMYIKFGKLTGFLLRTDVRAAAFTFAKSRSTPIVRLGASARMHS